MFPEENDTRSPQEVIDAVGERKGQEFLNYCNRELENPLLRREVVCDVLEEALRAVRTEHEHLEMAGPRALSGEYRYPLQWRKGATIKRCVNSRGGEYPSGLT